MSFWRAQNIPPLKTPNSPSIKKITEQKFPCFDPWNPYKFFFFNVLFSSIIAVLLRDKFFIKKLDGEEGWLTNVNFYNVGSLYRKKQNKNKTKQNKKRKTYFLVLLLVRINSLATAMFPSYGNRSVDLSCKSTNWFLYDRNIGR